MIEPALTQKYLIECFEYDAKKGELIWKSRPKAHFKSNHRFKLFKNKYIGKIAGCSEADSNGKKYKRVSVGGKRYFVHRLIWFMERGEWPKNEIDHINGNGLDNRIENLRSVDRLENGKNQRKNTRNKSGCVGVMWDKKANKWRGQIKVKGKCIHLGVNIDWFEVVCLRKRAEIKYGFHENHGEIRAL